MIVSVEQRKDERFAARELSKGELYHPNSGQYLRVKSVRDVSIDGIGLMVDAFLEQGEKIRLGFKYGRSHIQMYGRVIWCSPAPSELSEGDSTLFMLGVSL
ncbi:PilZ domain-containing protein [Mariprofundus sp. KV]|nr:PilZ domain-containing protein [Mariprofundus sp. KV]NWF36058.1 PilZ domain-containing protein [Mariprofundus sp. KV]